MLCHIPPQVSFGIMFIMTGAYFLVELTIGFVYNSLVLQADAYHMLSDVISMVIGFIASKMSNVEAVNEKGEIKNTFGWVRSEVVGALINSIFLFALCFTITVEALTKFAKPEKTDKPMIVMIVAIVGLLLNAVGLFLFHDHAHGHSHHDHPVKNKKSKKSKIRASKNNDLELPPVQSDNHNNSTNLGETFVTGPTQNLVETNDVNVTLETGVKESSQMNMKGVYLHIFGDFMGSIIVIVCCIIIQCVDQPWVLYLDPSFSLISAIVLGYTSVPLAKSAIKILIQTVPKGFDINSITNELQQKFDDILSIHDFHLWQLVGSKYIATIHIKFKDFNSYIINSEKIKNYFHSIGIHSLTLQPEFYQESVQERTMTSDQVCLLSCPPGDDCKPKQCC